MTFVLLAMLAPGCFGGGFGQKRLSPPIVKTRIIPCPRPVLSEMDPIPPKENFREVEEIEARENQLALQLEECHRHYKLCEDSIDACQTVVDKHKN